MHINVKIGGKTMGENNDLYRNFVRDFSNTMCNLTEGRTYSNIIFLCIGTQRLTGDAFGPLTGNRLTTLLNDARRINVIGTLENSVSLCNINNIVQRIKNTYTNPFIIAIDSALSTPANIGSICVCEGGLTVGTSLNRSGVTVGEMNIRAVVGRNCGNANQNLCVLQNVPLSRVVNLAEIVSSGIYNSINYDCCE